MKLPNPTPASSATTGSALGVIASYLLTTWPAFNHAPGQVQAAAGVVITGILTYLGSWLAVVRTPGQEVVMKLTSNPLPTLQAGPTDRGTEVPAPEAPQRM